MLRLFAIVVLLTASSQAAISVVAHNCYALGSNGGTTTALNITGASNLVIGISGYSGGTVPPTTLTDSTGNTLTGRTAQTSSEPWIRTYDVDSPITSSSYTVTATSTGTFISVCIIAWSGGKTSSSFDKQDGAANNSSAGTSVQATTGFTPTNANSIIVSFLSYSASNTPTIDSSFGAADRANYTGGSNEGISMSWQIQTTATARQPTWSWITGTRGVMTMDAYAPATGAAFSRTASDTALSGETVARLYAALRAPADTSLSVETTARIFIGSRAPADTSLSAESVSRQYGYLRSMSDTTLSAESPARSSGVFARIASNTAMSAESVVRAAGFPRVISSTTLASAVLARASTNSRSALDTALSSESIGRRQAFLRSGADDATTTPTLTRTYVGARNEAGSIPLAESTGRIYSSIRSALDSTPISLSIARAFIGSRTVASTTLSSLSLSALKPGAGAQNYFVSLSATTISGESVARIQAINRASTDSGLSAELVTRSFLGARTAADSTLSSVSVRATIPSGVVIVHWRFDRVAPVLDFTRIPPALLFDRRSPVLLFNVP